MNRGVSSIQKTLKKYGPLRTHSGYIVSFRENKIGHRSSENGAMHDIDFGDVLSTPAPVAASVATKKTHKKEKTQLQTFFSVRFSGFFHRFTELGERCYPLSWFLKWWSLDVAPLLASIRGISSSANPPKHTYFQEVFFEWLKI